MTTTSISEVTTSRETRPTMKQVAALAGVGTKTVSRVLNGEPGVAAATAQRVHAAVRSLDYQLDLQAGSLRRGDRRTQTLGLLVGSVDNPFCGLIHRAVEDCALERGVAVFASSLDDDPSREETAVRAFVQRRVDGLVLTTALRRPDYLTYLRSQGVPAVFIDHRPVGDDVDAVTSDNRHAAREATNHLITRGHRRIAFLGDLGDLDTARERRRGFMEALGDAGIPSSNATVVMNLGDEDSSHRATLGLIHAEQPPTAIFSAQNLITIGAVRALRETGRSHTIALLGFDDFPMADLLDPGVTVVAQDPYAIGRLAAERIFSKLDGNERASEHTIVPTQLIERGSGEIPHPDSTAVPDNHVSTSRSQLQPHA